MSIAEKLTTIAENEQKVYEAGKKSQYDEFWDSFQDNGNRTIYARAFQYNWNDINFKPKYDMNITGSLSTSFAYNDITDLASRLEECNVKLDTTNATSFSEFVYLSGITRLPELVTYGATGFSRAFTSGNLITMDNLVLKEDGSQSFTNTFQSCTKLTNIKITGKIGNDVSFSNSPNLTYDSLMSIINALKDYKDTGETRTLTLHADAKGRLSESDIAIATQKGWTVA
ncbi:MAG: hypothetical protein IKB32_00855 [Clostridia bacterium]|nr:hypothetical protein [Clostridia bacterium]